MKNAKIYFIFEVVLYLILLFLSIKGPGPNDPWEYNWIFQIIGLNLINLVNLILVRIKLKKDPVHKKIISRLGMLFILCSLLSIMIVI